MKILPHKRGLLKLSERFNLSTKKKRKRVLDAGHMREAGGDSMAHWRQHASDGRANFLETLKCSRTWSYKMSRTSLFQAPPHSLAMVSDGKCLFKLSFEKLLPLN